MRVYKFRHHQYPPRPLSLQEASIWRSLSSCHVPEADGHCVVRDVWCDLLHWWYTQHGCRRFSIWCGSSSFTHLSRWVRATCCIRFTFPHFKWDKLCPDWEGGPCANFWSENVSSVFVWETLHSCHRPQASHSNFWPKKGIPSLAAARLQQWAVHLSAYKYIRHLVQAILGTWKRWWIVPSPTSNWKSSTGRCSPVH